jgi:hypothetical protein
MARIWINHKQSFVKINVTEDRPIEITTGGQCDEGYHIRHERYELIDGVVITLETTEAGADCDGRYSHEWDGHWVVGGPTADAFIGWDNDCNDIYDPAIQLPQWTEGEPRYRDYAAEAAGY